MGLIIEKLSGIFEENMHQIHSFYLGSKAFEEFCGSRPSRRFRGVPIYERPSLPLYDILHVTEDVAEILYRPIDVLRCPEGNEIIGVGRFIIAMEKSTEEVIRKIPFREGFDEKGQIFDLIASTDYRHSLELAFENLYILSEFYL